MAILSAYHNAQNYNDDHAANYVRISTVLRPTKRNKCTTVLESHDKQSVGGCDSSIEDEIEIDAELDKCQNAAGRKDPQQLSSTDEFHLSIAD